MTLLALLLSYAACANSVDFAGAKIVVSAQATDTETFAARELSRYFSLLSGKDSPVVSDSQDSPAIFIGVSPEALPDWAGAQAYMLRVVSANPPRLRILGNTPIGAQYGVYSLLEKLGVGFYLGGDALPEQRESILLPRDLNETKAPAFKIRGSLPWYNFLNSPTTWDLEDYQFFFDQMAKMKMNFVGFHSYDHEPFCAYPEKRQWRMGAPAATSMTYGWGAVRHLRTKDFGFGTGRYFPYEVFGSRSVALARQPHQPSPEDALFPHRTVDDDAIIRAQCVLAQGLQYAKGRGLKVCLGFELVGDPTNPEQRRMQEARIRHMLATYPMLDYVWFWQSEGLGAGSDLPEPDSPLDLMAQRYRPVFEYLGSEKRIAEAARVTAWIQWAHGVVKRLRPEIGVCVSGWGGDRWMRFSDFYVGLDKLLPSDIVFAALDNIDPSWEPNVSAAYGKLSPAREKWPIPWWESDGGGARRDQWGPQCNVKPFTNLVRDALAKGCQGILGIHWQTRGVEEVAAYVAEFAWNPNLTYEEFYEEFARKCYGEKHGPEMARIHMRLEALGPRWTGSLGQVECGHFSWFSSDDRPKPENLKALQEIDARLAAIEADCQSGQARRHLERLRYLRATIRFLTKFDEAALKLTPGGSIEALITEAERAKREGNTVEAERLATQAIDELRATTLADAMQTYATRLTTQGDFGNLATINVKAYGAFLDLWERATAVLGKQMPPPTGPATGMNREPSRKSRATPLPDKGPVVYGPYVHREMAMLPWTGEGWLRVTALSPAEYAPCTVEAQVDGGIQAMESLYHLAAMRLSRSPRGHITVRVTARDALGRKVTTPPITLSPPGAPRAPGRAKAELAGPYLARLTWEAVPEAATYEVHRSTQSGFTPSDQTRIAQWPWTVYDDVKLSPNTSYEWAIVAVNDVGMCSTCARTARLAIPEEPPVRPPANLAATSGPGRVTLTWQPCAHPVSGYTVFMRLEPGGEWERVSGQQPLKDTYYVVGLPDTAPRQFAVCAIDRSGRDGDITEPVTAAAGPVPREPVLAIAFNDARAETGQQGTLYGNATIHDGVLDTRQGGWIAFPKEDLFQLSGPLTLAFWINLEQVKGIPVMVSFGHWEGLGYWMQLIGGKIRWYLPVQKFLDAGSTPGPGWHHLCGTYDGRFSRLYVDGTEVGSREVGPVDLRPWPGEFRIGMYSDTDEQYQTCAQFDDVRVYQRALAGPEVSELATARK